MKNILKWIISALTGITLVYTAISCFGYMKVVGSMKNPLANFLPMIVVILVTCAMCALSAGLWSKQSITLKKMVIVFAILIAVSLAILLMAKAVYVQFS